MRKSVFTTVMAAVFAVLAMTPVFAGNLDQMAAPTDPTTAMFTLESIYQRLLNGAAGTKRPGPFAEPGSGPTAGTGHTLDQVMGIAPVLDNTTGATAGNVLTGKKFWGLTSAGWGLQAGTLACAATATGTAVDTDVLDGKTFSNSLSNGITGTMANKGGISFMPTTAAQTIAAGYYNGTGTVAGDADLIAGNIKSGVDIFGVTGTYSCGAAATGDAVAADVLTGKTFSNGTSSGIAGAMANNGAVTIMPGTTDQTIAAGYHNGLGTVSGDADLVAGNIVSGKTIFGVSGSASAAANPAPVPKTGEPTDGATGVNFPNPRFTVNAGTVKDNLTGLSWLKNANCANMTRDWATAKTDVISLNTVGKMNSNNCGDTSNGGSHQTDWRLPTLRELHSLIHYGYFSPALSDTAGTAKWTAGNLFDNVQSDYYWSATTFVGFTDLAWVVYMGDGSVSPEDKATISAYVWPVR